MNPQTLATVRPATAANLAGTADTSAATGDRFCRALAGYTLGMQRLSGAMDMYHEVFERTRVLAGRTEL